MPQVAETESYWQATVNLFWREGVDREVKDAIQKEQDEATSWHTQLRVMARQTRASRENQRRWRAQIYGYWRGFLAFATLRYKTLLRMKKEDQIEQARRFVVRLGIQSVPT